MHAKPCVEGGRHGYENPVLPSQPLLLARVLNGGKGKEEGKQGAGEHRSWCVAGSHSLQGRNRLIQARSHPMSSALSLPGAEASCLFAEHPVSNTSLSTQPTAVRGSQGGNADLSLCCSDLDSAAAEVAIFADLTSGSQQPAQRSVLQSPFVSKKQTFHS